MNTEHNDTLFSIFDDILHSCTVTTLFQPIYNISGHVILGFEALTRGPKNTPLEMPEQLFSYAASINKLSELELLCREKAIECFVAQNLPGKLFLNVSPRALLDPKHPTGQTLNLVEKFGLSTNRIVIEVTEQDKVDDGFLLLKTIAHYRKLGFSIAIDDLGAGYSGLKQWSELCPEFVKIDRYFVDYCDQSVVKREFLKSISELAKATNTAVIAEGIERIEELTLLKQLGIINAQGFLLARPSPLPQQYIDELTWSTFNIVQEKQKSAHSISVKGLTLIEPSISELTQCQDAHKYFEKNKGLTSLAVTNTNQEPTGLLHRDQLTEIFAAPYGHALHAKKSVLEFMDKHPLIVDENSNLDIVSQQITEQEFDIRRHIIITKAGKYLGLVPLRDILKHITEEKIRNAQHANPLTMLPGNVAINEAIEYRLKQQINFSLAYIDLNHFKQFNDLYGYASGDSVIKLLAEITMKICEQENCFVGHIGGDDFMVVFDENNSQKLCHHIIDEFALQSKTFFTPEHIIDGGYWAKNREGQKQFVPLLTLSVGLVTPDLACCKNSHQVAALATDAKKEAKRYRGSYLFVCNRRKPSEPSVYL